MPDLAVLALLQGARQINDNDFEISFPIRIRGVTFLDHLDQVGKRFPQPCIPVLPVIQLVRFSRTLC
jgi:hypothetical protein